MKNKIFKAALVLSSAFLFSVEGKAQITSEIRDYYYGNLVTGDTVYFWVPVSSAHGYNFNQYNIGTSTNTYKVRKANLLLANGASSNFCVYHNDDAGDPQSQCYIPSIMISGDFNTDTSEFNTLIADFASGPNTGMSIVRYTFFDINNGNDSVVLTLVYNVTPVGITEAPGTTLGEPYPNPSNGNVSANYNFSSENGGSAVVTDLSGKVVYTESLASKNGILNIETSSWAEGVYVLSLTDENGIAARRKIVVE